MSFESCNNPLSPHGGRRGLGNTGNRCIYTSKHGLGSGTYKSAMPSRGGIWTQMMTENLNPSDSPRKGGVKPPKENGSRKETTASTSVDQAFGMYTPFPASHAAASLKIVVVYRDWNYRTFG